MIDRSDGRMMGSGRPAPSLRSPMQPGQRLPILGAKFAPPRPPGQLVSRPRLGRHLDGWDWRVALLTGAPGTGKTTAASEWLHSCIDTHRAWVTLDAEDDRPERFWLHIESALEMAAPESFAGRRPLRKPKQRQLGDPPFADLLFDAASLDQRLVIVLDQLDQIRDPSILNDLTTLTEHLPTGMQLVFTSRTDPQLPLAKWRARSWLVELRQGDLAFSMEEARALFANAGEIRLSADDIDRITTHTEGWVAALRLALLSMRDQPDAQAVASSFSGRNRMVADLLVTEVLDRQPDDIRRFLLQTSILGHLDAEVCNAVAQRSDSDDLLRSLETSICFVTADDERRSYRYHQLFGELLRLELERRSPQEADALHRRAGEHLEGRGDIAEAVGHYLAVGYRDHAFDLAFASAFNLWDRNDTVAAAAWIDVFPSEYIGESVNRMLVYAFALAVCDRFDEGVAWLERATHRLSTDEHPREEDLRHADALRLLQFSTGGSGEDGIACGQRAVEALDRGMSLGAVGDRLRPNLARAHLLVDDPGAASATLVADTLGDEISTLVIGPAVRARISLRVGNLRDALEHANRAIDAAAVLEVPRHLGVVDALIARAGVYVERNQLDLAIDTFDHLHEVMESHHDNPVYGVLTRLDEVRVANIGGRVDHGFAVIDEARYRLGERPRPAAERLADVAEARWRIESGELRRAQNLIDRLPADLAERGRLQARLDLARDQPEATLDWLHHFVATTFRDELTARVLRARALVVVDPPASAEVLLRAIELAVDEQFTLIFLEEGRTIARQARIAAEGLGTPGGNRLAAALGAPRPAAAPRSTAQIVLSQREDAVLRFLPSRLTNKEIARECFMSVNTVKTHLKSIYSKLGASTRSEAIDEARRLNML